MPFPTAPRFWFVTGSQHLYGPETLRQVEQQASSVCAGLAGSESVTVPIENHGVVTSADAIRQVFLQANADDLCAGIIVWMHTFSPAQMWIHGLSIAQKPLLHLHTQYHRDIPWATIDMDFMNLNQSAHGDREWGFMANRLGLDPAIVMGHWQDPRVAGRINRFMRSALAWHASGHLRLARFGDNMRNVAVTEGDKVEAASQFGWLVNGYGTGDLVDEMTSVAAAEIDAQMDQYHARYAWPEAADAAWLGQVREQARIECGLRHFLTRGAYSAFTTTFEDLHGLSQLPGLAVQNLMADGYGFGAEGDWKTAALVRLVKVMADGGPTSFMEDYTYHLAPGQAMTLGAHMLEVCPSIAADRPTVEVHPLAIGGRSDPARLVFTGRPGPAVVASLVDLGPRFRLVVNVVEAVSPPHPMPKLPVGHVLWKPAPSLETAAEAWIRAGGAHHTVFSYGVDAGQLEDWATMASIECVVIDESTDLRRLARELRWNRAAYR